MSANPAAATATAPVAIRVSRRRLGVLAALNRVYFSRFHLKRVGALAGQFALAPPELAARLDALPRLAPREAADEVGRLAEEPRALVHAQLPDIELPFRFPPGTRQRPFGASRRA